MVKLQLKKIVIALGVTGSLSLFINTALADQEKTYSMQVNVGAFYGNKDQSYSELDVLFPILENNNNLIFADARGVGRKKFRWEGNIGGGYRHINDAQTWMLGAYSFFDRRKTPLSNLFNQVTVGGELKSTDWTILGNGYIPLGVRTIHKPEYQVEELVPGENPYGFYNIYYNNGMEKSLAGGDFQIGHTIPFIPGLTAYAGAFYFHADNIPTIKGPVARLTFDLVDSGVRLPNLRCFDDLQFQTTVRHDQESGTVVFAGLRMSMNFGGVQRSKLPPLQRHMLDYIYRDVDIVTGNDLNYVVNRVNNPDGSPVTVELAEDESDLQNGVTNNADIIAVDGTITTTNTLALRDGQILTTDEYIINPDRSMIIGENGRLQGNQDLVQVGEDNTIQNVTLETDVATNDAITNAGNSVGDLTIYNISTNAPINLALSDGSRDSHVAITDSVFAITGVGATNAINFQVTQNSLLTTDNIDDNVISIQGNGATNQAINMTSATGGDLLVNSIDDNAINVTDTTGLNRGINITATDGTTSITNINNNAIVLSNTTNNNAGINIQSNSSFTLNEVSNNSFNFGTADSNVGISLSGEGGTISAISDNTMNFAAATTSNNGIFVSNPLNTATMTVNNLNSNVMTFQNSPGADNWGIQLSSTGTLNSSFIVNNQFNTGTAANNYGIDISTDGGTLSNITDNSFTLGNSTTANYGLRVINNNMNVFTLSNISDNQFTLGTSTNNYGMEIQSSVNTITASTIDNNTITLANATNTDYGIHFVTNGGTISSLTNNTITLNGIGTADYGIFIDNAATALTVNGINLNTITNGDATTSCGINLVSASSLTMTEMLNNTIDIGNSNTALGVRVVTDVGGTINGISNNTITVAGNAGLTAGIGIFNTATVAATDALSVSNVLNNNITVTNGGTGGGILFVNQGILTVTDMYNNRSNTNLANDIFLSNDRPVDGGATTTMTVNSSVVVDPTTANNGASFGYVSPAGVLVPPPSDNTFTLNGVVMPFI